jgi:S-methylmethionine-dependent homocysteine/selenocysteine methylase
VHEFKAFDKAGKELPVSVAGDNGWAIKKASKLAKITYNVEDTWDATIDNLVYPMCGTSFEAGKNFVINTPGLFGYFDGMKKVSFDLSFSKPQGFYAATGLKSVSSTATSDQFRCANTDELYDSPLMFSLPDTTTIHVGNADVLVAGNLSTTWVYHPGEQSSTDRVRALIDSQIDVQMSEGVDFFIAETFYYLGEALIALERVRKAGLPVMVTMLSQPVSRDGKTPVECARQIADAGADIVGLNCLRNPAHTLPWMQEIRSAVSCALGCQPAAYQTPETEPDFTALAEFPLAMEGLQLPRMTMGEYARQAQQMGIGYIGACCGAVASHVREMAKALGKVSTADRRWQSVGKPMSAYEYHRSRGAV